MHDAEQALRKKYSTLRNNVIFARVFEHQAKDPEERLKFAQRAAMLQAELDNLRMNCPELTEPRIVPSYATHISVSRKKFLEREVPILVTAA